ncbi:MAG: triose-phosphate isomerase [Candidatus Eisenbacteria bacterium]|uniref:Triosephosphate isomerase n=1 Tax=Eiseniibacteriota bacterium TaxID=2212470 RepID=A0A538TRX7_UNCEI|nr:MAG: triose-phosphate isomerase [Candidatus Eisenbacteria bacterium]
MAPWPRRPRLVAGNWKMNRTAEEAVALARQIVEAVRGAPPCEVVLCPPYTALESVRAVVRGTPLRLGGQNLHPEPRGPHTGEISGPMLVALGCQFAIVGHSERRRDMHEDDALVARKLRAALRHGLAPIVCVGETVEEREQGHTPEVLARQVAAAYTGLASEDALATVLAYEPVWAIGTGRVATPEQAEEAHRLVRDTLDRAVGAGVGARATVLYGGSVTAENAASLFAKDEVDGALVGGASLEAEGFVRIAAAAGR